MVLKVNDAQSYGWFDVIVGNLKKQVILSQKEKLTTQMLGKQNVQN